MTDPTATSSYRPGRWFAILGDHATVLLPPSERDRAARLWPLVDDGAGFDVVLDALISGGLRGLPGFVLVGVEEHHARVVVRGRATARVTTADRTVEVTGSSATTWAEQLLDGVSGIRLVVADGEGDDDDRTFPVDRGLVRVRELLVTTGGRQDAEAEADPRDGDEVSAAPPGPIGPEPDLAPTPPEPPVGAPSGPPPPVVPTGPPRTATLLFSHGEDVPVDRSVLVGRSPRARGPDPGEQPRLVRVPSPAQEISSTHLEVRPPSGVDDEADPVAIDLGSTNGTVLVRPGGTPEELEPGRPVPLPPGAVLDLGDGVTIRVADR